MDSQVRRQTAFTRPPKRSSRARRSSRISQDSSRAFSCHRHRNDGAGRSSRNGGRSYGKINKNRSSNSLLSSNNGSSRSRIASSEKRKKHSHQPSRRGIQPAGLSIIPKVCYVSVILPRHIADIALKWERQERERYLRLGTPIPLNLDESDADMNSAYGQIQNDIREQASDCSSLTHADTQKDSPLFDEVPFPKGAVKGISYRWQQQHPGWRDGRYRIDPPSALSTTTAAAHNQAFPQSTTSPQSGSRGSESSASIVYGDPKYYSQSPSPASDISRRFLLHRQHDNSRGASIRKPNFEVYKDSDGSDDANESYCYFHDPHRSSARQRYFEVYRDSDISD